MRSHTTIKPMISLWLLFALLASSALAEPQQILIDDFSGNSLASWEATSFSGHTEYRIVEDAGQRVLHAHSKGAASGLAYSIEYEPSDYPILSWRWKIDGALKKGDSRTKSGDDYAARVYVIFPHWFFPKTKTLNYIWANRLPKESVQANAYTSNAMMLAVESGDENAGQWIAVRRDIVADYRRAFGEDPPSVGSIAVMTDTDNTGETATAWYDDFIISAK